MNSQENNDTRGQTKRVFWRWPRFPLRDQSSRIGAGGLNDRVREGTGCDPAAPITRRPRAAEQREHFSTSALQPVRDDHRRIAGRSSRIEEREGWRDKDVRGLRRTDKEAFDH